MKLFKLFAFSLIALPSVALGMESTKSWTELEALLEKRGDSNVVLSDEQVKYLCDIKSSIKEYKPSTKITGPRFILQDGTELWTVPCDTRAAFSCVSIYSGFQNVVPCSDHFIAIDGKSYSLTSVYVDSHREKIREYVASGRLGEAALEYILAPERAKKLIGFGDQVFKNGRKHLCARFTDSEYVFWDNGISMPSTPWYRRKTVWAAAAVAGLGCYYRDSLAELLKNPAPVIEKAQTFLAQTAAPRAMSLWAGIKSVFSR